MTNATHEINTIKLKAFEDALAAYNGAMAVGGLLAADFALKPSPDLLAVARKLGVSVFTVEFPEDIADVATGLILPKAGEIYINSALDREAQTEALLHEIGHAYIDMAIARSSPKIGDRDAMMNIRKRLPTRLSPDEMKRFADLRDTEAELRADAFGRLLLLPTRTMERCLKNRSEWPDARIAEAVGVTVDFIQTRLQDPDVLALKLA